MHLDKDTIVNYLRSRSEHDRAIQAERDLPADVDHDAQGDLLSRFGVPGELLAKRVGVPKMLKKR